MKRFIKSTWIAAQALAISAGPVFAQNNVINLRPTDQFNKLGKLEPGGLVSVLVRLVLVVAALAFFFWLVIGGIRYIVSGGDKTATEAARGQITAALVGLVIVFAAWAISALIGQLFGVDILQLNLNFIQ